MGRRERTVLVVEDEASVRMAVCEHLTNQGFLVLEAACAAEAMDLIGRHPEVDLVFTDLQMPGDLDGLDLAQWLLEQRPDVPVILTSGVWARIRTMHEFSRSQSWPYFIKPYRYESVAATIRKAIEKMHLRKGGEEPNGA